MVNFKFTNYYCFEAIITMNMKGNLLAKIFVIVFAITVFLSTTLVSVSAAEAPKFMGQDDTLVQIQNPQAVMTIPGSVTKIGSNVVTENPELVKELVIGTNIKEIASGAFTNCGNLETVKIHQNKYELVVAPDAFNSNVNILYLDDFKPTTTTKAPETTQKENTNVETTKEETKSGETTTKQTETTTEESDVSKMIVLDDATPFSDAKEQLANKNIWDEVMDQTTENAQVPKTISNPIANTASYTAVVVVGISVLVLGYLKFKR